MRKRMRDARLALNLRMREAAERVGISESYWSKIESGQAVPSLPVAGAIAALLGVLPTDLFDELKGQGA